MAAETLDDNALVALERVQEFLNLSTADGEDDLLVMLVNRCSAGARKYLGYDPLSKDYAEHYDGRGDDTVVLRHFPVLSVWALSDDGDSVGDEEDDYSVYADEGIIRLESGAFAHDRKNVYVGYAAGYAESPKDIQDGVTLWVQARFAARGTSASANRSVQSERVGDHQITYAQGTGAAPGPDDMPDETRAILDRYRTRRARAV